MRAILLAAAAAASTLPGGAQTGAAPAVSEPTVVTVTGYPLPVSTVPAAVTVLGKDTVEGSCSASFYDILSTSALLNINRNGGQGGYSSITIRGGKPNFTLVLVDGIEINDIIDSLGGAVDFSPLTTDNIQQVEIVRGPLSAVYGSDAVSGVVNFVSRRGASQPVLDVSGMLGSFGTRNSRISTAGQRGKLDYSLSGSFLDVGEQVKQDPYRLGAFSFHSGIALGRDEFLGVTARFTDSTTQGFPVGGGGPEYSVLGQAQRIDARQWLIGAVFEQRPASFWDYGLAFDVFSRGQDLAIPAILDGIPASARSVPATMGTTSFQRYHGSFTNGLRLGKSWSAHVTGGLREDTGWNHSVLAGVIPDRFEQSRTIVSATGDLLYAVERWTASVGVRADKTGGYTAFVSPHAGIRYQAAGWLRLHSSWGEGYKLPSFYSLSDPLIGNRNLLPEYSRSIDAGLTAELLGNRITVDAGYFRNRYRDLIDFSAQQFRLINRSEVRTQGLELEARARVSRRIELGGSYSQLDWKLEPADEPFRNVPRWRAAGRIAWNPSARWQWGAEVLAVGRRADFELPVPLDSVAGGYSTVSLHAAYEPSRRVSLSLRVDNLLDARYHLYVGFPDPGIYVRAGVTYHVLTPGRSARGVR